MHDVASATVPSTSSPSHREAEAHGLHHAAAGGSGGADAEMKSAEEVEESAQQLPSLSLQPGEAIDSAVHRPSNKRARAHRSGDEGDGGSGSDGDSDEEDEQGQEEKQHSPEAVANEVSNAEEEELKEDQEQEERKSDSSHKRKVGRVTHNARETL